MFSFLSFFLSFLFLIFIIINSSLSSFLPSSSSNFFSFSCLLIFYQLEVCQRPFLLPSQPVNQLLAHQPDLYMQRPQVRTYVCTVRTFSLYVQDEYWPTPLLSFPTFHLSHRFFLLHIEYLFCHLLSSPLQ